MKKGGIMTILLTPRERTHKTPTSLMTWKVNKIILTLPVSSILRKSIFDTKDYYYFTEVWKEEA
jgi:hypothetical protein